MRERKKLLWGFWVEVLQHCVSKHSLTRQLEEGRGCEGSDMMTTAQMQNLLKRPWVIPKLSLVDYGNLHFLPVWFGGWEACSQRGRRTYVEEVESRGGKTKCVLGTGLGTEHASWVQMQKKGVLRGCVTLTGGDLGIVALL